MRLFALACLLLCAAVLPLLAQPELVPAIPPPKPVAPPPPPQKTFVKKIDLQFVFTSDCLKRLAAPAALGGMRELVPEGIDDIVGLMGLNAILVRSENALAIDRFEAMIRVFDTEKRKSAAIVLLAVELPAADAEAILARRLQLKPRDGEGETPLMKRLTVFAYTPSIEYAALTQALAPIMAEKRGTMQSMNLLIANDPQGGIVDLRAWQLFHTALLFSGVRVTGDDLELIASPVLPAVPAPFMPAFTSAAGQTPEPLHIAKGYAVVIDDRQAADNRRQLLLLALDSIVMAEVGKGGMAPQ